MGVVADFILIEKGITIKRKAMAYALLIRLRNQRTRTFLVHGLALQTLL
jgi:hypothetical protein